jgi:regulator of protease activity HflC (stomatin/prohibitin superfamily)
VSVLDFLGARTARQRDAFEHISAALAAYDVECIDTLIGDIAPPAELMRTQTDRKIAEELERTYEVQREAQIKRQALERETAVANMQIEVVRSEQMVKVAQQNALAVAEQARGEGNALELRAQGEGNALRLRAEGQAASVKLAGDAEASAVRAIGAAKAGAYTAGREALGEAGYTAMQIATILGEHHVKVVPDIAVTGDGTSGMANVMLAKLVAASGDLKK